MSTCSMANHHWQIVGRSRNVAGTIRIEWHCPNCDKRREWAYSIRGGVISRRYMNPPGYKPPAKGEALSRDEWREIYLRNLRRRKRS